MIQNLSPGVVLNTSVMSGGKDGLLPLPLPGLGAEQSAALHSPFSEYASLWMKLALFICSPPPEWFISGGLCHSNKHSQPQCCFKWETVWGDVCSFVHVQSELYVWPQAGSPTCKCIPHPLPLFGSQNQIAFFCLLHACKPNKSRLIMPRPIRSK